MGQTEGRTNAKPLHYASLTARRSQRNDLNYSTPLLCQIRIRAMSYNSGAQGAYDNHPVNYLAKRSLIAHADGSRDSRGYGFHRRLSVCLSVCLSARYLKNCS